MPGASRTAVTAPPDELQDDPALVQRDLHLAVAIGVARRREPLAQHRTQRVQQGHRIRDPDVDAVVVADQRGIAQHRPHVGAERRVRSVEHHQQVGHGLGPGPIEQGLGGGGRFVGSHGRGREVDPTVLGLGLRADPPHDRLPTRGHDQALVGARGADGGDGGPRLGVAIHSQAGGGAGGVQAPDGVEVGHGGRTQRQVIAVDRC